MLKLWKILTVVILLSAAALAADQYSISVTGTSVLLSTKGAWEVDMKFPWELECGTLRMKPSLISKSRVNFKGAPIGTKCSLRGDLIIPSNSQPASTHVREEVTIPGKR